jgi:hypothetical protein
MVGKLPTRASAVTSAGQLIEGGFGTGGVGSGRTATPFSLHAIAAANVKATAALRIYSRREGATSIVSTMAFIHSSAMMA